MANPKDILVITTSSVEGLKIKKYLKPVSAHIVAGTNLFNDFLGGISDVFGGRSQTYQRQLTSLYDEAIERIKYSAHEIGGNCIVGLTIDMDEISGKGKSMFMLTAVGTAVIIDKDEIPRNINQKSNEKFENVSFERVNESRTKKEIIEKANNKKLTLNDETWNFIISNQVEEVYPFLISKLRDYFGTSEYDNFYKNTLDYIESLDEEIRTQLLYENLKTENDVQILSRLVTIIKSLNLYNFERTMDLLKNPNFNIQKIGLRVSTYDKAFYSSQDVKELNTLIDFIKPNFKERGVRSLKKQLLSSQEKEIWTCDCGKANDIGNVCNDCNKDIFGFASTESKPSDVENFLKQKVDFIREHLK